MTSQPLREKGGKSTPLKIKTFFLVTLFSAVFIYTMNQKVIAPMISTIDSSFSQSEDIMGDKELLEIKKYREVRGEL